MDATMLQWLLGQSAVVVVLGLVVWFQYKESIKKDDVIREKDKETVALAEKAIKIGMTYESTKEMNTMEHTRIMEMLKEVKDAVVRISQK